MRYSAFGLVVLMLIAVNGCSSPKQTGIGNADPASYGMAKKMLEKGKTTQQQVVEIFGAPVVL